MRAIAVLILMATWPEALNPATGVTGVAFVRNNEICTANEDGSQAHRLTSDGKPKQFPKWSPDGRRIAYLTEGDMTRDPKSRAKIEIIDKDGKHVGTAPVLVTMADGSEVGGMRWIDDIGWFGSGHVFVEGSASPYSGEFRTIDIRSGQMGGYVVSQSATCPAKGLVAYWAPVFPPSKSMRLEINEREVGFSFPDYNVLSAISVPLLWTPDCEYLAFLDLRPPGNLVVIQDGKVARKVKLSGEDFKIDGLTPDERGLLLVGSANILTYDFPKNTPTDAPQSLLKQIKRQREKRERVVRELGGEFPDWFTDPPTPLPANWP